MIAHYLYNTLIIVLLLMILGALGNLHDKD